NVASSIKLDSAKMNRNQRLWIGVTVLLGLALCTVLAFVIGASEAIQECEVQGQTPQAIAERFSVFGHYIVSWRCLWSGMEANDKPLTVLSTIGLFLVTTLLAFYTYKLWRDAAETAAAQAVRTEKALLIAKA